MKNLITDMVWSCFCNMGMFGEQEGSIHCLMKRASIIDVYYKWLEEWMRLFEAEGYVYTENKRVFVMNPPLPVDSQLWRSWELETDRWMQNPNLEAQAVLLDKVMRVLPEILTGKILATEVIFPGSSLELVEGVYKNNPIAAYYNLVLSEKIVDYVRLRLENEEAPNIRIIEVGAGTGATTALVLEKLKGYHHAIEEYHYTDISNAFINHAEKCYGGENPFLTYGILNIEKPVAGQGYQLGSYDIVIGANVLHATKNIRLTMRHVKSLLSENGLVYINEFVTNSLFSHMTFGMLEGWWYYEDQAVRHSGSPGLTEENWLKVLKEVGFRSVVYAVDSSQQLEQQIIIAESDGILRVEQEIEDDSVPKALLSQPVERKKQVGSDAVADIILSQLSDSLRIDKSKFEVDEPFSTYGLDSILAVNLTKTINEGLGIELDVTALFEHSSLGQLSDFIVLEFGNRLADLIYSTSSQVFDDKDGEADKTDEPIPGEVSVNNPKSDCFDERHLSEGTAAATSQRLIRGGDIAIIGINGKFPDADCIDQFWRNINSGTISIKCVPQTRREWDTYRGDTLSQVFSLDSIRAGFLDNIQEFDPLFFSVSLAEARQMTPEQRLMLMCIWNTLEDSGYTTKMISRKTTGVFVATGPSEYYHARQNSELQNSPGLLSTPSLSMMPNRISYHFNLKGPSEFFDTTCSSSLSALNRAVRALQGGECELALVGGINLIMSPMGFINLDAVGMLSKTGSVKPFQEGADGTVRGEGVGAVLLKPLEEALADNDHIYALIKGTSVAHGGKGVSMTAPNIQGMKMAISQALARGEIDPDSVTYIEAHGMSTGLADGAEIAALKSAFKSSRKKESTYVTSIKPCVGHTEVVSGMAALFRTIMAMRYGVIPGIANFGEGSSAISFTGSPLQLSNSNLPWEPIVDENGVSLPRRACINSFGISGVNAHIVLEEAPVAKQASPVTGDCIVIVSAQDGDQLALRAKALLQFFYENRHVSLSDVAATLQLGRVDMPSRLAVVAQSIDEVISSLEGYLLGDKSNKLVVGEVDENCGFSSLLSGDSGDALFCSLLAGSKYTDIATFWCNGANVDWARISSFAFNKIPLPGYPFKKIDCWLDEEEFHEDDVERSKRGFDAVLDLIFFRLGVPPEEVDLKKTLADYGLNSLLMIQIQVDLQKRFPQIESSWLQVDVPVMNLIGQLEDMVCPKNDQQSEFPELVRLNEVTEGVPVFWIHGALGSVESFRFIAQISGRPLYGIQARGAMTEHSPIEGIDAIADYYQKIIRAVQPEGPYDIGGYCLGGILAYEVARRLQLQGQKVDTLVMVDSPDSESFTSAARSSNIPLKGAALQVANSLLWPASAGDEQSIVKNMIRQDEVDESLEDEAFIDSLAEIIGARGVKMHHESIVEFIFRNVAVQVAYKLVDYVINPLPKPEEIKSVYFRNASGKFFGFLQRYFQTETTHFDLDDVSYWSGWQREMPDLKIIDVDASSHMSIMYEKRAKRLIRDYCEEYYQPAIVT